jgi:hypothetical protein
MVFGRLIGRILHLSTDTHTTVAPAHADSRPWIQGVSLTLGLLALWTLTHRFRGLAHDGVLYAVQALARVHPYFATDVMLSGTSQDAFTLFSPLYAALIRMFGIIGASTLLFALCTAGYLCAAWLLIRRLFDSRIAYLTVAVLICVSSEYGAWSIFSCSEDFLTARSLGEACVVGAIAAYYWQRPWLATGLSVIAMLIHPLMALPGLLLLLFLIAPARLSAAAAVVGLTGAALVSLAAVHGFVLLPSFKPMEAAWLEVVEQRSMFLFLKEWRIADWEVQLRPLLFLALAQVIIADPRVRKLCWAACLLGLLGLALAAIPDAIGPIPILLQGQAWRWGWITCTVALCMLAPCASLTWRIGGWGRLCASLMVMGWVFPPINAEFAFAGAGLVWAARSHIRDYKKVLDIAAYAVVGIISVWTISNVWELIDNTVLHSKIAADPISFTRWTFSLAPLALACAWGLYFAISHIRTARILAPVLLAALAICFLPSSLFWPTGFIALRLQDQYKTWREAIPESSSVLVLDAPPVSAIFAWFTLERTSYTSSSQSAGVVFSEKTAAEIRRRSEVLKPVIPPDWRILSQFQHSSPKKPTDALTPPSLTAKSLESICRDSELGFVIAKDDVGFSPVKHTAGGNYVNWNLYDCRSVRAIGSGTT